MQRSCIHSSKAHLLNAEMLGTQLLKAEKLETQFKAQLLNAKKLEKQLQSTAPKCREVGDTAPRHSSLMQKSWRVRERERERERKVNIPSADRTDPFQPKYETGTENY